MALRTLTNSPSRSDQALPDESALGRLCGKLEAIEHIVTDMWAHRLPNLEGKLDSLQELLSSRRRDFFTIEETAQLTRRSAYSIRRWIKERRLSATRIAEGGPRGKLLIARAELERLIASGKGGQIPEAALG